MAKTKAQFTDVELETLRRAARSVWDYVGGDALSALAEEGRDTMKRAEVIELALDAGRLEDELTRTRSRDERAGRTSVVTDDLLARWNALDYETCIKLIKPAFPYATYGM